MQGTVDQEQLNNKQTFYNVAQKQQEKETQVIVFFMVTQWVPSPGITNGLLCSITVDSYF